eukprot:scaffold18145_cov35-Tisochrysis_lutea.AAC.10
MAIPIDSDNMRWGMHSSPQRRDARRMHFSAMIAASRRTLHPFGDKRHYKLRSYRKARKRCRFSDVLQTHECIYASDVARYGYLAWL